jgi:hypothetical protein
MRDPAATDGTPPATRNTTIDGALAMAAGPVGLATGTLDADVSSQLRTVAPTFGQVLASIGQGVADSQTALDNGVVETVSQLASTNITVVTDVIQHLGDDGLPDIARTQLITQDLSVLNFFMPTVHEWKRVIISMDLSVGAFDNEQAMMFHAKQHGFGTALAGLFWGFIGVGEMHNYDRVQNVNTTNKQEASWSQGQVRLDATLGPRTTGKLPVPDRVVTGPQITMSQGTVVDADTGGALRRSVDVIIAVLKRDGSVNANVPLTLEAGSLLPSFATTGGFTGSITNAQGKVKVTLSRNLSGPGAASIRVPLVVRMNTFSQSLLLTI